MEANEKNFASKVCLLQKLCFRLCLNDDAQLQFSHILCGARNAIASLQSFDFSEPFLKIAMEFYFQTLI